MTPIDFTLITKVLCVELVKAMFTHLKSEYV